eukprot:290799_1
MATTTATQPTTDTNSVNQQTTDSNTVNIEGAMMTTAGHKQTNNGILDIECIKPYIDVEFDDHELSHFLVSSIIGSGCAYQLIQYGAIPMGFELTVIFLWLSTISAIVYTVYCKYYAAYKASTKHNITYWNALKYIAVVTELKLDMRYSSSCWNKYQLVRIVIVLLEDVIQLTIGLMFMSYTNTDVIVWLSTTLSTICIVYTMSYVLYRFVHDLVHKLISFCGCSCLRCICMQICCEGVERTCKCCCIGGPLLASVILLAVTGTQSVTDHVNVYTDYGFMYAEAEFYIDELHVLFENKKDNLTTLFQIYDHSIKREVFGRAKDAIYCVDSKLKDVDKYVSIENYGGSYGDAAGEFNIDFANDSNVEYPVICLKVFQKYLMVYFADVYRADYSDVFHYHHEPMNVQYIISNEPLEVDTDGDTIGISYPDDFTDCGDIDTSYNCDQMFNVADGAICSINYTFSKTVQCKGV